MEPRQGELLFTILHFNDVYDIQPNKKGTGGIVNFQAYLRQLKNTYPNSILLFSGDCFSPSILSNVYQGKQMVYALNKLNIDVAQYGNHQFDFEPEVTQQLANSCNFPWLLGNIKYKGTDINQGSGIAYIVKQKFGLKLGIFGVAGEDWVGIMADDYDGLLQYHDVGEHSQKMCKLLREDEKCDIVIALTHMRVPQDQILPLQAPDIDIILGGHDHIIMKQFINGIPVLKSGDNFKTLGIIKVFKKDTNLNAQFKCKNYDFNISVEHVPIATAGIDLELENYVRKCMEQYSKNDNVVGFTEVDLECRFSQIRTKQTNYGNFVADLARAYFDSDMCALNSGSFRSDTIIKKGQLTYSVVSNIINDLLVVKEVPGSIILEMLQFSVSNLPNTFAGSFLVVSGIKYSYDYRKNPRIQSVQIAGAPLDINRVYTLTTFSYLAGGGDGFSMLKNCKFRVDLIGGIDLLTLQLRFFKGLQSGSIESHKDVENQHQNGLESTKALPQEAKVELAKKISSQSRLPEQLKLHKKMSIRSSRISRFVHELVDIGNNQKCVSIKPSLDNRIISLYP